ncbi:MAG: hypothetical protein ACYS80_24525, partial [Planctomycetota bacterium]
LLSEILSSRSLLSYLSKKDYLDNLKLPVFSLQINSYFYWEAFGSNKISLDGTQCKSKSLATVFSVNRLSNFSHRYFERYLPSKRGNVSPLQIVT